MGWNINWAEVDEQIPRVGELRGRSFELMETDMGAATAVGVGASKLQTNLSWLLRYQVESEIERLRVNLAARAVHGFNAAVANAYAQMKHYAGGKRSKAEVVGALARVRIMAAGLKPWETPE